MSFSSFLFLSFLGQSIMYLWQGACLPSQFPAFGKGAFISLMSQFELLDLSLVGHDSLLWQSSDRARSPLMNSLKPIQTHKPVSQSVDPDPAHAKRGAEECLRQPLPRFVGPLPSPLTTISKDAARCAMLQTGMAGQPGGWLPSCHVAFTRRPHLWAAGYQGAPRTSFSRLQTACRTISAIFV